MYACWDCTLLAGAVGQVVERTLAGSEEQMLLAGVEGQ